MKNIISLIALLAMIPAIHAIDRDMYVPLPGLNENLSRSLPSRLFAFAPQQEPDDQSDDEETPIHPQGQLVHVPLPLFFAALLASQSVK